MGNKEKLEEMISKKEIAIRSLEDEISDYDSQLSTLKQSNQSDTILSETDELTKQKETLSTVTAKKIELSNKVNEIRSQKKHLDSILKAKGKQHATLNDELIKIRQELNRYVSKHVITLKEARSHQKIESIAVKILEKQKLKSELKTLEEKLAQTKAKEEDKESQRQTKLEETAMIENKMKIFDREINNAKQKIEDLQM